jgi:hypothetical protein
MISVATPIAPATPMIQASSSNGTNAPLLQLTTNFAPATSALVNIVNGTPSSTTPAAITCNGGAILNTNGSFSLLDFGTPPGPGTIQIPQIAASGFVQINAGGLGANVTLRLPNPSPGFTFTLDVNNVSTVRTLTLQSQSGFIIGHAWSAQTSPPHFVPIFYSSLALVSSPSTAGGHYIAQFMSDGTNWFLIGCPVLPLNF